uniref:Envelope fusion protein n=1 Tax=Bracon brevicornis TaxID=1563983 RepID=A0A6V7L3U9_9HYME
MNSEYYNINYITYNPGLFYEDVGKMKTVEEEWQIIATIDFMSFHHKIYDEIEPFYEKVYDQCIIYLKTECEMILKRNHYLTMLQEVPILNQHIQEIFGETDEDTPSKNKRAPLLGLIGNVQRSIFGTMDYNDYKHINKEIDRLYSSQGKITHLVNNATHLIKSEIDSMMHHMKMSVKNLQFLKNVTDKLEKQQNREADSIFRLEMAAKFSRIGDEVEHSMRILLDSTKKLVEAIDAAKHGRITQSFLSPEQLHIATKKIHNEHPELEFPIPKGVTDYAAFSRISGIRIAHTGGKILIIISLPLLNRQELQIFHVHPCAKPQRTTSGMVTASIRPKKPFLIVTEDRHHYALVEKSVLDDCSNMGNYLVCLPKFAISNSVLKPACEVMLLLRSNQETLKMCNIRLSPTIGTEWTNLGSTNKWLFSTIEEENAEIYCHGKKVASAKIHDTGIVSLGQGCHLQTPTDRISHMGTVEGGEVQIHLPAVNLDLQEITTNDTETMKHSNFSEGHELLQMPELKNLRDFDMSLEETQRKLEEIGQQKQETYHHKLMTFGTIGGIGLLSTLGICYALCSKSTAISAISTIFRCCTKGIWKPRRNENPLNNEQQIRLEQLTTVSPHTLPKQQRRMVKVISEPDLRRNSPPEEEEHFYEVVQRAVSMGAVLDNKPMLVKAKGRIISV